MKRLIKLLEVQQTYFIYDIEGVNLYKIDRKLYESLKTNEVSFDEVIPISNNDLVTNAKKHISNIHLNVAQVCNLVCGYCYGIEGEYGLKGKMKEGNALRAIDYLIENSGDEKKLTVVFFGGEPLLNFPLIKTVVDYCVKKEKEISKKIGFEIVTNGTKFDDEINNFLNHFNFEVTISFDGDKETQDKNRPFRGGKGSYDKTLPKIKSFLDSRNGNATARATITNHSKDLLHYRNNLRSMGFRNSFVEVATLSDFSKEKYNLEDTDTLQKKNLIKYDKDELNEFLVNIKERNSLSYFKSTKYAKYINQLITKSKKVDFCGVSRSMRGIAVNGDVYPCHRFVGDNDFKIGNVKNENNNKEKEFDLDFVNTHPQCKGCFAKYYCGGGGCIHNNYIKNGAIDKLDLEHCHRMHNKIKSLFKFYDDLTLEDRKYMVEQLNIEIN
ncbi:SPASM domain-containing protein [Tenacibaculum amylolyticum]|uniref:SPASM domain-containing protein n=1 Tax=Tenacibaculum amylolyticum TaxID=104269 RepID=UPI003893CEF8